MITTAHHLADIRPGRADVVTADGSRTLGRVTRTEYDRPDGPGVRVETVWEARLSLWPHEPADAVCASRKAAVAWIVDNAPADPTGV